MSFKHLITKCAFECCRKAFHSSTGLFCCRGFLSYHIAILQIFYRKSVRVRSLTSVSPRPFGGICLCGLILCQYLKQILFLFLETLCFCKGEKFNIGLFQTIWRACIHAATLNPSPLWLSIPGHLYYSYYSIPTQNWIIITISTPLTFVIKFKKLMTMGSRSLSLILSVHITNGHCGQKNIKIFEDT